MGFDEGSITLDREDGTYYAGETLHGVLQFRQDSRKTFRGIYVKVKGFAHTHWTTSHTRRGADGKTHTYTVSHDGHEDYFSTKLFLVGSDSGEHHLEPGVHRFPFQAHIPAHCPSSFEGEYGHVRYKVKVVVDRSFKFDQEKEIFLTVFSIVDLNADPSLREPLTVDIEDSYCCWCVNSGGVQTSVRVPTSGVVPGQTLAVEVACDNRSNVELKKIKMAIKQDSHYRAHSAPGSRSGARRTIVEMKKGSIPGKTSRSWTVELEVPADATPCGLANCSIIDMGYVFEVTTVPQGCHTNTEVERFIVIGTVPLGGAPGQPRRPPANHAPLLSFDTPLNHSMFPAPAPALAYNPTYPYPNVNQPHPSVQQTYPGYPAPSGPSGAGQNPPYPANPYTGAGQGTPYPNSQSPYHDAKAQQANAPNAPYPNAPPTSADTNPPPYPGPPGPRPGPPGPPGVQSPSEKMPPAYPAAFSPLPYPTMPMPPNAAGERAATPAQAPANERGEGWGGGAAHEYAFNPSVPAAPAPS